MDSGNHRYTNEKQKCILFICKYDIKKNVDGFAEQYFCPPPPNTKTVTKALKHKNSNLLDEF